MDIDFLIRKGAIRSCRRCGAEMFIPNRGIMEQLEDERGKYPVGCSDCGMRYTVSIEKLRGHRKTQLYRISITS